MIFDVKFQINKISFKATFDWYNSQPGYGYTINYDGITTSRTSWTNLYSSYGGTNSITQVKDIVLSQSSNRTKIELINNSCQRNSLPNYLYVEYLKVK